MIERGSPGRKLFGLFSYIPKLRLNCSQVLWYNLNTKLSNKSGFEGVNIIMNKEGILREINNDVVNTSYYPARSDCCDLDGEIFEDVVLDNIKCHRMTFQNCTFRNVQFIDNQVDLIEFENCQFINTVFKGTLENLYLIISDSSFSKCTMHDLKISGYEEQSEITDCTFEECTFSDINLLADLTLQGGTVTNCTGNNLECIMNMIFAVQFTKSKFENINLNVAIIKNTFQQVEVSNIQNIDIGGEPVRRNNTFKDCYINGELQNQ